MNVFELERALDGTVYLKLRLFPSGELLQQFEMDDQESVITDSFYDDMHFTYIQNRECIKQRNNEAVVRKIHQIDSIIECDVFTLTNTSCVLQYQFTRKYVHLRNSTLLLVAYLDTLSLPFEYQVLTIRLQLTNTNTDDIQRQFQTLIDSLKCRWGEIIPVALSKFVFAFKCLPVHEELEFNPCVDSIIENNIHLLLSNTCSATEHHLYVWTCQQQLYTIARVHEHGRLDDVQCKIHLEKMCENIKKGKTKFQLFLNPYDDIF